MQGFTPYSGAYRQNSWLVLLIIQPIVSWCASTVPPSIDANYLSICSVLLLAALSGHIALGSDPELGALPTSAYVLSAAASLLALLLANADFVVAKRTKSNASQAELLQLVCDNVSVPLYTFVIARVLLLSTAQTLWLLVSIYSCFYIAACGKGVLGAIVSLRLVGPTEGVVAISVISTITVFTTPIIWQHVIDTGYLPGLQVNHLLEVIAIVLMFWYFCSSFEHLVTASEVYLPSGKPVSTVPKAVSCVVELIVLVSLVVLWNSFSSVSFAALSLALISAIFTSVILATHSGVSQKHCRWLNRRTVFVSALLIGNHVPMMLGLWGETILDDDWWGGACLLVQLSLLAIYLHSASADLQMMIIND